MQKPKRETKYSNEYQPQPLAGFFHGIDPATKGDYYTDIVHVLTQKPMLTSPNSQDRYTWLPFLVGAMRLKHRSPDEIIDQQIKMFNKFPPTYVKIDSTREEFLSNALVRKFGESTIQPVKFMNSGSSNTKYQLKQVGYNYLNSGYQWPDVTELEIQLPRFAKIIKILQKEMKHEQVDFTDSGRVTFKHPIGKHNDLVHGWELSLAAVMEYQEKNLGYEKRKNKNQLVTDQMKNDIEEIEELDEFEKTFVGSIYDRLDGNSAFSIPG